MSKPIQSLLYLLVLLSLCSAAWADDGLVNLRSQFDVAKSMDRFEAAVKQAGLKVFARIDHAQGAVSVGQSLRPTQLLIFGSPKIGTGVISSNQRAGFDLPLKALAWRDAEGAVWVSYLPPSALFERYGINDREKILKKMTGALAKFSKFATQEQD